MTTFVLIHGAWHGGWCWERLTPLLEGRGHRVIAPDLPGMGADQTPLAKVSLALWTRFVCRLLRGSAEPVVLVGHSRGGVVISEVAERAPGKVRALVYLTAIVLPDGASVMQLADQMSPEGLAAMSPSDDGLATRLSLEAAPGLLFNTTPQAWIDAALPRLGPDPVAANTTPVRLTPRRYGRVRRHYIECLRDQTLSIGLQRRMQASQPGEDVVTLDTDHSPFYSAPEALADALCAIKLPPLRRAWAIFRRNRRSGLFPS